MPVMNNQRILIAIFANATSLAGWVVLLVRGQAVKGGLGWMFLLGAAILLVLWLASIYVLRALLWQIALHGVRDDVLHASLGKRFRSFVIERRVAFSAFVIFTLVLGILSSGFSQVIYFILVPVLVFSALLLEVILPFSEVPKNGSSQPAAQSFREV